MAMISLRKANTRLSSEVYHILYVRNLRFNISSEEMHSAIHQIPIGAMLRLALVRPISTGFREERDTFGPISVPHHNLWGAQTQRSLQNFDIYGEREQMSESIIRAFRVLKKCTAKVSMCVKRLVYTNDQGEIVKGECSNFLCDLKPGADVKIT